MITWVTGDGGPTETHANLHGPGFKARERTPLVIMGAVVVRDALRRG